MPRKARKNKSKASKSVVNLQKRVKDLERDEPTYIIGSYNNAGMTTAIQTFTLLNGIQQGNTVASRKGQKVKWKYLNIRILCASLSALQYPTMFRFLILREKTNLGSLASTAQIFGTATPNVLEQYNHLTRDFSRWKVYYDSGCKVLGPYIVDTTSATSSTTSCSPRLNYHIKIPLSFTTNYSRGNAGDYTDIDTNGLYVCAFTDNTVASAVNFKFFYTLIGEDN